MSGVGRRILVPPGRDTGRILIPTDARSGESEGPDEP